MNWTGLSAGLDIRQPIFCRSWTCGIYVDLPRTAALLGNMMLNTQETGPGISVNFISYS